MFWLSNFVKSFFIVHALSYCELLFLQIAPFDPTKKKKKKKPVIQDVGDDTTDKLAENVENLSSKFEMARKNMCSNFSGPLTCVFLFVCIFLHNQQNFFSSWCLTLYPLIALILTEPYFVLPLQFLRGLKMLFLV